MDANGLRFWMLALPVDWVFPGDPPPVQYDETGRAVRLASQQMPVVEPTAVTETAAIAQLDPVPQTRDQFGTRARWDGTTRRIMAMGVIESPVPIYPMPPEPALTTVPTDLAIGFDGVLYIAFPDHIMMVDRRNRWAPFPVALPNFTPWRLAAAAAGGVWVLGWEGAAAPAADRTYRLARLQGMPRADRPYNVHAADVFRPCQENPAAPRLTIQAQPPTPAPERPVAIATSATGHLAILSWQDGNGRLHQFDQDGNRVQTFTLEGARYPYTLAWLADNRIAVLVTNLNQEALVYDLPPPDSRPPISHLRPVGDFYPLRHYQGGAFLHGLTQPPHYPTPTGSLPLYPLSLPTFVRSGELVGAHSLDSGSTQTVWHRLYLEGEIPPTCGIRVFLAATDTTTAPTNPQDWYEHRFGQAFAPGDGNTPCAAWVSQPCEIPFHPGLWQGKPVKHTAGLFTVLIQRCNRAVRDLKGRYLWVKVTLTGDGRTTPELAAIRAYGSRFSYRDRYLPELYRETTFGRDADQWGRSTAADFLERFLDNFEGILTPLEDRIAQAHRLTDPSTTPTEALAWLASWIGLSFDPSCPSDRQRRMLQAAPELFRQRGTLDGLKLALDLATDNAVSGGEVVILEDFRLRRTFATILGADLADAADPLLGGIVSSGNAVVGDTLILGDEHHKEFLAVFSDDRRTTRREDAAIADLFDRLAHRLTVLVHQSIAPQDLSLIRRIVELETPAHVLSRVFVASQPFIHGMFEVLKPAFTEVTDANPQPELSESYPLIVGAASLVGVDTYLARKPQPRPVRVDRSQIGVRDLIQQSPSLDPRIEGSALSLPPESLPPTARATAPATANLEAPFQIDASTAEAAPGRRIVKYIWTRIR